MRLREKSYKSKQFFIALIKLCVVLLAFYAIFIKLLRNPEIEFSQFLLLLKTTNLLSVKTIGVLLLLSTLNWFFEIYKWKLLVKSFKNISFYRAMQESLGSLTASVMTPNRIGEYAAKAIAYKDKERVKIVFLNFVGNMTQMLATLIFGLWGFYQVIPIEGGKYFEFNFPVLVLIAICLFLIVSLFIGKRISIKGYSITRLIKFIKKIGLGMLLKTQLLAIVRYLVFSFQMLLLFRFFGNDLPYFNMMALITTMYLIASLLPSLVIFDVIVKGSVAVYVFGYFGISEMTTLSVIMLMWIFNFVIPSILGSYFVLNFKPINQLA